MTNEELNKYIQRFPKRTQQALSILQERNTKDILLNARACYEPIEVYRAVKSSDNISSDDFISMPEQRNMDLEKIAIRLKKDKNFTIESFGVSVNENLDEMIASVKYPSERHKGILKGIMKCENGIADFEQGKTHHNWYIFQDKMNDVVQSFHKYK